MSAASPATLWALGAFLAALAAQRVFELARSARHVRALLARGGVERGAGHYPLFVTLHVLFPVALAAEVLAGGARPDRLWPLWLALLLAAQLLRFAAMRALGEHWTTRILVVPGMPRIARGPYRFTAHPNYVAVTLELLAAPLLFGAWRTAIAAGALNTIALAIRIPAEGRALREAGAGARAAEQAPPAAAPAAGIPRR